MRIRSIKPDFWTSRSISALPVEDRLLFIGLWSYVDDNGVGLDRLPLITAALFPDDIERDPSETFARVSRGLATLSEAGRIARYSVDGHDYLHVTGWEEHQRIDRPGKNRYPDLTRGDVEIRETVARVSRQSIDMSTPGEGEKGRRGEGDKPSCASDADASAPRDGGADASTPKVDPLRGFDEWWDVYAHKVDRHRAEQKWKVAIRKKGVTPEMLIESARSYIATQRAKGKHPEFTKNPSTWLNSESWTNTYDQPADDPDDGWGPPPIMPRDLYGGTDEDYRIYLESMRR